MVYDIQGVLKFLRHHISQLRSETLSPSNPKTKTPKRHSQWWTDRQKIKVFEYQDKGERTRGGTPKYKFLFLQK